MINLTVLLHQKAASFVLSRHELIAKLKRLINDISHKIFNFFILKILNANT